MPVRLNVFPGLRVKRSAQALKNGEKILAEVLLHERAIVAAAERGVPPVSAVSITLKEKFPEDMKAATVRQFVGTVVKAVLLKRGYEVFQTGVRLPKDTVFSTGSVYRKAAVVADKGKEAVRDAFAHMITGLTPQEKRILLDVVRTALGEA